MPEAIRVVARFANGKLLKGTTQDFAPNRSSFHLIPIDGSPSLEVRTDQLKALFFVKDLQGNPDRTSLRGFLDAPATSAQGRKLAVRFTDEEFLCGHTLSYQPGRPGFFMTPVDETGNNIRIYVVVAATVEIKAGLAAEALAAEVLGGVKR
ncbi:MAG: DUF6982 domain-containing protein [Candidatus Krumholzibacteriia bacterium]